MSKDTQYDAELIETLTDEDIVVANCHHAADIVTV